MKGLKRNRGLKIFTLLLSIGLLFTLMACNPKTDDSIAVTSVSITSTTALTSISTHRGTLQLKANVLPIDATNKLVTWSVLNGTGTATINQEGILSALTDGIVTVKVVLKSNESVSDSLAITISNQVTDNKAPLAIEITQANVNLSETMTGTSSDEFVASIEWVLASDKQTYIDAITQAETTLTTATLTDAEVNAAVNALELATTIFNNAKQMGTKSIDNINLGSADEFVILSKTGISTTGTTQVIGNIGVSPVSASYITGFGLIMDAGNEFSTSSLLTGKIYAADYAVPTPDYLTTAIADMMIAYNDGQGRTADYTELYTGDLSGKTLNAGVYKWSNDVLINTDLTLNGNSTDVFIFQIAGTLTMAANTKITLTGGALPENIYFVVADTVAIGTESDFQGVILSMTNVSMGTGSTIMGMIYAQTSVSLDATVVTKP